MRKRFQTIMKKSLSDQQIVEGLLLKQERLTNQIVSQLYQDNKGRIKQMVFKCGGSLQDAEDVFQEVILIFIENVWQGKFLIQNAKISTYIYGIAEKVWFKKIQKNSREKEYMILYQGEKQEDDSNDPHKQYTENEEQETLISIFNLLKPETKEVLNAFYKYKHSMQEIATHLNLTSIDSAKMRKYRGFQEWKQLLIEFKFI